MGEKYLEDFRNFDHKLNFEFFFGLSHKNSQN